MANSGRSRPGARGAASLLAPGLLVLLGPALARPPVPGAGGSGSFDGGFDGIRRGDVEIHLENLATERFEGRDSPSIGLRLAGDYVVSVFEAAGLEGAGPEGSFRLAFERSLDAPRPEGCSLELELEDEETVRFGFGGDFVPLAVCTGDAEGHPVFAGFGISERKEKYDELRGLDLDGNVAVILEGEPRHKKKFDGPRVTRSADVHKKLEDLRKAGAVGALVVRRGVEERDGETVELGYRYTWAQWTGVVRQSDPRVDRRLEGFPVLEITPAVASRLIGEDVEELGARLDRTVKPIKRKPRPSLVRLSSSIGETSVPIDNVVGILRGSDPELADEYVVIGAHLDHVGVDYRAQIGFGADDNASGTTALLEIVQALAEAEPRRSILACAFSAEEDGMLGSRAICDDPPVPLDSMVAMINLDMVGRGETGQVVVLGAERNADLGRLLKRARRLRNPRIKIVTGKALHLWPRSDHFSFHQKGVPVLFFFEAQSELQNPDYHTFNDTLDKLDLEKITRTARIAYNTAWILADDDDRPSPPRD